MKLSRAQLAVFLTERGFPTSKYTLDQLCQPSVDQGPPSAGRWGRGDIYEDTEALAWAEARAIAAKENLRPREEPVPKPAIVAQENAQHDKYHRRRKPAPKPADVSKRAQRRA